jgi:hypothetical protein
VATRTCRLLAVTRMSRRPAATRCPLLAATRTSRRPAATRDVQALVVTRMSRRPRQPDVQAPRGNQNVRRPWQPGRAGHSGNRCQAPAATRMSGASRQPERPGAPWQPGRRLLAVTRRPGAPRQPGCQALAEPERPGARGNRDVQAPRGKPGCQRAAAVRPCGNQNVRRPVATGSPGSLAVTRMSRLLVATRTSRRPARVLGLPPRPRLLAVT